MPHFSPYTTTLHHFDLLPQENQSKSVDKHPHIPKNHLSCYCLRLLFPMFNRFFNRPQHIGVPVPNASPRPVPRPTPSRPRLHAILGTIIVILLTWGFIVIVSKNGMKTPPLSSPKFSAIHLPTMPTIPVAIKDDDPQENDEDDRSLENSASPTSVAQKTENSTEESEGERENTKNVALIIGYATKDPNWSSYSKQVQGCLAAQLVANPRLDYSGTVQRCKDYYSHDE